MKNIILTSLFCLSLLLPTATHAQIASGDTVEYFKGVITDIRNTTSPAGGSEQTFTVKYCCDANKNEQFAEVKQVKSSDDGEERDFSKNDRVVILHLQNESQNAFYITEHYRLNGLLILLAIFVLIASIIGRKKSLAAFAGLGFSFLVLMYFIVPQIIQGHSPLIVGTIGSLVIALIAIFMAHGIEKKTVLAVQGTIITIALAFLFSAGSIWLVKLFGKGSEDAFYVQSAFQGAINMKGLLLIGMIIGVLGVLDDVTTALTATIEEIHTANPALSSKDLFQKGMRVGREHIASLINTLVLAYAGSSLPLLLLFRVQTQPWWVSLNSQFLAEEITRAIIGSTALILAVPITTFIAARAYGPEKQSLDK